MSDRLSPLRLIGRAPQDLRQMCRDWWISPLAGALLAARPREQALSFVICRTPEGGVQGRLVPEGQAERLPRGWAGLVEKHHQQLFCAPLGALDADPGFAWAWEPFCAEAPGTWTVAVRLRRAPLSYHARGERSFSVQLEDVAVRRCADDASAAAQQRRTQLAAAPLDPGVEALLAGLAALDQRDRILEPLILLHDALFHRRTDAEVQAALGRLLAALEGAS